MSLVLLASLVTCLVTCSLAGVLLIAERYLVRYGTCRIEINDGSRDLTVTGGDDLLSALRNQGIFIPSACGGRGTCAYCKVKIIEGGGPVGPTETPLLTSDEIAGDVRISCQCRVRNDLKIEIPEQLLAVRQYRGRLERTRDLTHDIKELRIKLIEPERIEFVAGQYIQLEAPPYGDGRESVYRAYSISSPPDRQDAIELIIRLVPGGICTTWVFEHLREGQEVSFAGPFGEFRMSDSDRPMIWIAGGSGMAPFWSMIRHMKANGIARKCTYFFGSLAKRDLFYLDELNALGRELDWFEFAPALSGRVDPEEWSGQTGLITEVVERNVDGADGKEAYLCGSPGMIDASIEVLRAKGIGDEDIYYDKF